MDDFVRHPLSKLRMFRIPDSVVTQVRTLEREHDFNFFYLRIVPAPYEDQGGLHTVGYCVTSHFLFRTKPKMAGQSHVKLDVRITLVVSPEQYAKYLEQKAKGKHSDAINDTRQTASDKARRKQRGEWTEAV